MMTGLDDAETTVASPLQRIPTEHHQAIASAVCHGPGEVATTITGTIGNHFQYTLTCERYMVRVALVVNGEPVKTGLADHIYSYNQAIALLASFEAAVVTANAPLERDHYDHGNLSDEDHHSMMQGRESARAWHHLIDQLEALKSVMDQPCC